jgi:hypothetical protein
MPSKAEHRARIRSSIMVAVADLNHFNWDEADDALLDYIDQWLELKTNEGRTISAVKGTLDHTMSNPET